MEIKQGWGMESLIAMMAAGLDFVKLQKMFYQFSPTTYVPGCEHTNMAFCPHESAVLFDSRFCLLFCPLKVPYSAKIPQKELES